MRADSIEWRPIRLGLSRMGPRQYALTRGTIPLGWVKEVADGWMIRKETESTTSWNRKYDSFVVACLHLAREYFYIDSDTPQDYGRVQMLRIGGSGDWYTVIFHRGDVYIYEDFTLRRKLTPAKQAMLRRVLAVAERWRDHKLADLRTIKDE